MFHPKYKSLIFIGLVQPQGAVWPLSDLQSQLAAKHISGEFPLPNNLEQLARKDAEFIDKEFIISKTDPNGSWCLPYARGSVGIFYNKDIIKYEIYNGITSSFRFLFF